MLLRGQNGIALIRDMHFSPKRWSRGRNVLASLCLLLANAPLAAQACQTALLLNVDVSNSIDAGEYALQIEGIASALRDPTIVEIMVNGNNAIALQQWSGRDMQHMSLPWHRINAKTDMEAVASFVETMPRAFVGGNTAVGDAIQAAMLEFEQVQDCARWIIDVSGDGADNAGSDVAASRRAAERAGMTVNGLAIEGMGAAITNYYELVVVTADGFVVTAHGFTDFARAIRIKIEREISRATG